MEKKVKLTQEQAVLIEEWKKREVQDFLPYIGAFSIQGGFKFSQNQCLNNLSVEELSICLLISDSYEVIHQYKVGDWIAFQKTSGETVIVQIEDFRFSNYWEEECPYWDYGSSCLPVRKIRHATPEEIQQEKKRRFWDKLGREVDGWKAGDIVSIYDGREFLTSLSQCDIDECEVFFREFGRRYPIYEIQLITPVEQRLDK